MIRLVLFSCWLLIPCFLWSQIEVSSLRGDDDLIFYTDDLQLEAGQEYLIDFRATDLHQYLGYQCTFVFNKSYVQFDELVLNDYSNAIGLGEDRFNLGLLDDGAITNIWSNAGINEDQNAILFSFKITALEDVTVSETFTINSSFITATSIFQNGIECGVELTFLPVSSIGNDAVSPIHIFPNPIHDYVQIQWPDNRIISKIQLFDMAGQQLLNRTQNINSPYLLSIPQNLLKGSYVLQLTDRNQTHHLPIIIY